MIMFIMDFFKIVTFYLHYHQLLCKNKESKDYSSQKIWIQTEGIKLHYVLMECGNEFILMILSPFIKENLFSVEVYRMNFGSFFWKKHMLKPRGGIYE